MQLGDGGSGQQRRRRRSMRLFFSSCQGLNVFVFPMEKEDALSLRVLWVDFFSRIACTYISGVISWGSVSCPFLDSPLTPFNRSEWNSHRWIDGGSSSCLCRDSVSLFSIGLIERYHNKTKQNINIIDLANVFIRFLFLIPRLSSGLI